MRGIGVDVDALDRAAVMAAAREQGLLMTTAGKDAFRFVPPLVITESDIGRRLSVFSQMRSRVCTHEP